MAVIVRSGQMRHPIEIQRATITRDADNGEVNQSWVKLVDWWCAMEPITLRSRERLAGSGLQEEAEIILTMRTYSDLKRDDRIVTNDGRTLEILALADVMGRERKQEAICKEVVPDGD